MEQIVRQFRTGALWTTGSSDRAYNCLEEISAVDKPGVVVS